MTQDYDRLIDRYISGEMSQQEEREFLARAGSDEQLGHLLNAERAIVSGTMKDRSRMPAASATPGAGLLAKLAATPPAVPPASVPGIVALKNGTVQAAIAAVAMLGIIIGAIFIAPLIGNDDAAEEPTEQAPVIRGTPPARPEQRPTGQRSPQLQNEQSSPAQPRNIPTPEPLTPSQEPSARQKKGEMEEQPASHTLPQRKQQKEEAFPLDEGNSDPTVFDNDTVRVEMKVGNDKVKQK